MKKFTKLLVLIVVLALIVPGVALATDEVVDEVADETVDEVEENGDRIAGGDRYETAVMASQKAYPEGADTLVLATGREFADGLTGTVLAAKVNGPLLLTSTKVIAPIVLDEIERLGASKVFILGGEKAIDESILDILEEKGLTVERISGENRYATAVKVAEELENEGKKAYLVSGRNYRDALVIGPVAAIEKAPILLTNPEELSPETKAKIEEAGIKEVVIIGGPGAIKTEVEEALEELDVEPSRVYGATSIETSLAVAEEFFKKPGAIFVASSADFADGLVGGYLGAIYKGPVLLTRPDKTDEKSLVYIEDLGTDIFTFILGGEAAISDEVADELSGGIVDDDDDADDDGNGDVEQIEVVVGKLEKDFYAGGDQLEFTISGFKADEEVRLGMPIFLGPGGWPWASSELVLTEGMVGDDDERYWAGVADKEGVLTVSGPVGENLPAGILHITIPSHGYYIDEAMELQDDQGAGVRVGEAVD